jgi:cytidyltransferase-like protein
MITRVIVSGGFDPIHVGHCRYFKEAKKLGNRLIVIVNTDDFLMKKKGFVFMPQSERIEIISNFWTIVDEIWSSLDIDMTVCKTLEFLKERYPEDKLIFAKGGDRTIDNIPEKETCDRLGIEMKFNIGGEKIQSSSELVRRNNNAKL